MDKPKRADMKCSGADWCNSPVYAKGLCNAHYLRNRSGADMDAQIESRMDRNRKCARDGCDRVVGKYGAYDLCKKHYIDNRTEIRKSLYIRTMGPECQVCGQLYPSHVYDFHHINMTDKEGDISAMLRNASDKRLAAEMSKCVLLCSNCHRDVHHGQISKVS